MLCLLLVAASRGSSQTSPALGNAFVNFETTPVHPIALSPDGWRLAVCNLADGRLEVFDVTSGDPVPMGSVPVGIDPVSVRFRNASEAWVVNHISDSISVVNMASLRVVATLNTLDTPADVVFAGSPPRAFVSCALPNTIQVFDPATRQRITNVLVAAERPKALAVSPDGQKVYAAIFESGNATTIVGAQFRNLLFFSNAVSLANGPYGGRNPPPNAGDVFSPPLNPALPTNVAPPATGLIVRKDAFGRWLDDNQRDWTEFVSGTNAALTQRVPGWDLPDRDLAILDTVDLSISYVTGLMNVCMALDVNPASGRIAMVGTDAINEVRFEPNLNGIFIRVKLALIDPMNQDKTVKDLNPHLDYAVRRLPSDGRDQSIGDPRSVAWTADGTRGYVSGMGSRNLMVLDAEGNRIRVQPIELGEGPCGLALDEARQRLYVFNRFSSSISVVDTTTETVVNAIQLFDPTPMAVAAGRRHFYDTRRTSGLGQAACASCHVDGRMDRLGWDLGNPAGEMSNLLVNSQGALVTNNYHPMKGVMVTQTLQDIIGHEPFHWRGDRPDLESFNPTFTNLQAAATALTTSEMRGLRDFLASIRFPPNPYRPLDNSLSTNVALPADAPLPNGNAVAGFGVFNMPGSFCVTCHTLPTGLGLDSALQGGAIQPIPAGPNGGRHFSLAPRLEGSLRSKISQFRNLADKVGMDGTQTESRAGFGFGHDGSIDSLTRFLNGVRIIPDQHVADLIAFLLSVSGSEVGGGEAPADSTPPAAVGRQLTIAASVRPMLFDAMLTLANSPTSRVDLIAHGTKDGLARGWVYDRTRSVFQSDREQESVASDGLIALAGSGTEITFTVVPRGSGIRLGIDRDLDGALNRDELDTGTNPSDLQFRPRVLAAATNIALGMDLLVEAQVPPLPAPLGNLTWWKDGQPVVGATNGTLTITNATFDASGDYSVVVSTLFQSCTSAPVRLTVVPFIVSVTPASQMARRGSNAVFTATTDGAGLFQFQWRFQAQDLVGATNSSLAISNAQVADEGAYRIIAANAHGAVTSAPVNLGVLVNPSVVLPALSQDVVIGGDATFSFMISGHPPPFGYQLKRASVILTNYTSDERQGFLTLFNVQPGNSGSYRITITNAANPQPGLTLDPVTLTVLNDGDHDGLADEWENAHGLEPDNAADAQLDSDLDGQTAAQEYLAGTDPLDQLSFLKVERLLLANGQTAAVLQFFAVSNRTYSVEHRSSLVDGWWTNTADVVALATNRMVSLTNSLYGSTVGYYRLVTPRTR